MCGKTENHDSLVRGLDTETAGGEAFSAGLGDKGHHSCTLVCNVSIPVTHDTSRKLNVLDFTSPSVN